VINKCTVLFSTYCTVSWIAECLLSKWLILKHLFLILYHLCGNALDQVLRINKFNTREITAFSPFYALLYIWPTITNLYRFRNINRTIHSVTFNYNWNKKGNRMEKIVCSPFLFCTLYLSCLPCLIQSILVKLRSTACFSLSSHWTYKDSWTKRIISVWLC